jgi:tetratricopeptide (TPR) repeat protein
MSSSAADSEDAYLRARDPTRESGDAASASFRKNKEGEEEEKLDDTLSAAEAATLKDDGNELFRAGDDEGAALKYTSALRSAHLSDEERAVLLANRAAVRVRERRWEDVVKDTTRALELRPGYPKALIRRKRAAEMTSNWSVAAGDAKELKAPQAEIAALELKAKQKAEKETADAMEQLKGLGNSLLSNFGLSLDSFQTEKDPETGSYSIKMKQ